MQLDTQPVGIITDLKDEEFSVEGTLDEKKGRGRKIQYLVK